MFLLPLQNLCESIFIVVIDMICVQDSQEGIQDMRKCSKLDIFFERLRIKKSSIFFSELLPLLEYFLWTPMFKKPILYTN